MSVGIRREILILLGSLLALIFCWALFTLVFLPSLAGAADGAVLVT